MKLHTRMAGKAIHSVWKCDTFIEVRFTDGTSLKLGWRDDNGELLKGTPDILFEGTHIIAKPVVIKRPPGMDLSGN